MRICMNCGSASHEPESQFCMNCGVKLKDVDAPDKQPEAAIAAQTPQIYAARPNKKSFLLVSAMVLLAVLLGAGGVWMYNYLARTGAFSSSMHDTAKPNGKISAKPEAAALPTEEPSNLETASRFDEVPDEAAAGSLRVFASSELPGYPASGITDGKNDTAWVAPTTIQDAKASVTILLGRQMTLHGLTLKNGCWNSHYELIRNGRVKELLVEFDDGSSEVLFFWDSALLSVSHMLVGTGETLLFINPHMAETVRLTVLSVYAGVDDSVGITEVSMALVPVAAATDAPPAHNADYLLPHSSTHMLTDDDLRELTKEELRIARNEIFARYGRQFNDEILQAYFNTKPWYASLPKLLPGTEPVLSELELENIDIIHIYEAR